jgi:hypothetical protein
MNIVPGTSRIKLRSPFIHLTRRELFHKLPILGFENQAQQGKQKAAAVLKRAHTAVFQGEESMRQDYLSEGMAPSKHFISPRENKKQKIFSAQLPAGGHLQPLSD